MLSWWKMFRGSSGRKPITPSTLSVLMSGWRIPTRALHNVMNELEKVSRSYSKTSTKNFILLANKTKFSVIKAISQYTDFSSSSDSTGTIFSPVSTQLIQLPNPFTYTDSNGTSRTITYTSGPSVVNALQFFNIGSGHTVYVCKYIKLLFRVRKVAQIRDIKLFLYKLELKLVM